MPVRIEEVDVVPRPEQAPASAAPPAPEPTPAPQADELARAMALMRGRENRLRAR